MNEVLAALNNHDVHGRRSVQDCLRLTNQSIPKSLPCDRSQLRLVSATISSRRIGALNNHHGSNQSGLDAASLEVGLNHIVAAVRLLQYVLEFSELQEPKDGDLEPKRLILSLDTNLGMDIIRSFQSTLEGLVGVICKRLEDSRDQENLPFDADDLFEAGLQVPGSLHSQNLRLAIFLQGSLSQLLQHYAADRPWLVPTILTPLVNELIPAVNNELPKALRHQMVRIVCGMLDEAVQTADSVPTNILQYMLQKLKSITKSPDTDQKHLPTVVSLLGALAEDSPLCHDLDSFLSVNLIRTEHESFYFALGKLRGLLFLLRSKPLFSDEIVEEILLRTLPVACFDSDTTTTDEQQRYHLIESTFKALTAPNLMVSDGLFLMCLCKASHPLSVEVCGQIIASHASRLRLAATLAMNIRTSATFRHRLVNLLLRLPTDDAQIRNVLKNKVQSISGSRSALASTLPLMAHFNIPLDPPFAHLLSGKLKAAPTGKLEQIAALLKAYRICCSDERCDFDDLLDHAILPCCSVDNDEDILSALFQVMYVVGPCANARFPEVFKLLFSKPHLHAKTVQLLLHLSSTIPKELRSQLQYCTSGNKELLRWIQARLNDTLFNPYNLDLEAVSSRHAKALLKHQPSRSPPHRLSVSEGSLLLQMPTQNGRSAIILFPPGNDSMSDIEFMLQGAPVDVLVLKNIAALSGGFQFQMVPGAQ